MKGKRKRWRKTRGKEAKEFVIRGRWERNKKKDKEKRKEKEK